MLLQIKVVLRFLVWLQVLRPRYASPGAIWRCSLVDDDVVAMDMFLRKPTIGHQHLCARSYIGSHIYLLNTTYTYCIR